MLWEICKIVFFIKNFLLFDSFNSLFLEIFYVNFILLLNSDSSVQLSRLWNVKSFRRFILHNYLLFQNWRIFRKINLRKVTVPWFSSFRTDRFLWNRRIQIWLKVSVKIRCRIKPLKRPLDVLDTYLARISSRLVSIHILIISWKLVRVILLHQSSSSILLDCRLRLRSCHLPLFLKYQPIRSSQVIARHSSLRIPIRRIVLVDLNWRSRPIFWNFCLLFLPL